MLFSVLWLPSMGSMGWNRKMKLQFCFCFVTGSPGGPVSLQLLAYSQQIDWKSKSKWEQVCLVTKNMVCQLLPLCQKYAFLEVFLSNSKNCYLQHHQTKIPGIAHKLVKVKIHTFAYVCPNLVRRRKIKWMMVAHIITYYVGKFCWSSVHVFISKLEFKLNYPNIYFCKTFCVK